MTISALSEALKSVTFFSTSLANSLNSSLFLINLEPCREKAMRADFGGADEVLRRTSVSFAFLWEIAAEREREDRSLAGFVKAFDSSNVRMGSRNTGCLLCSLRVCCGAT